MEKTNCTRVLILSKLKSKIAMKTPRLKSNVEFVLWMKKTHLKSLSILVTVKEQVNMFIYNAYKIGSQVN